MEAAQQPALQVRNLSKVFPGENGGLRVLQGLNFSLAPQEFVCLLGPSGSGKSTLLRMLGGLLKPDSGEVRFALGEDAHPPRVGLVFQQANLMPWRTALQNITLPLELQGVPPEEAHQRAQEWIELIGLQGFENTWPRDLSAAWPSGWPLPAR